MNPILQDGRLVLALQRAVIARALIGGQKRRALEEVTYLLSHRAEFSRTVSASDAELEAVFREAARLLVSLTGPP